MSSLILSIIKDLFSLIYRGYIAVIPYTASFSNSKVEYYI